LPSIFPIESGVPEKEILVGPDREKDRTDPKISFSGTLLSMGKIDGNVPAAKLPKKAKDQKKDRTDQNFLFGHPTFNGEN
jgi:hypothetical protein